MQRSFGHVAVVGAGAVGCFYGALLARAGRRVTLVGRPAQVQAIARDGVRLDMGGRVEAVRADAAGDVAAAADADLVLVCVKSADTEAVARALAPHLPSSAVVLSLQNGVENVAALARHLPQRVAPAVVYAAVALTAPGAVRHHGGGELVIGSPDPAADERLQAVVALFGAAGIGVRLAADADAQLWAKLAVNCAYNAISALAQAPYARLAAAPDVVELQQAIVREVVAVAQGSGVALDFGSSMQAVARIAATMPGQRSSTAQDLARRKPTEIGHLNGFIVRRGRELGIATPVNQALTALVRLVEATDPPAG
jgi:2-dehydropantoate 2-reductase